MNRSALPVLRCSLWLMALVAVLCFLAPETSLVRGQEGAAETTNEKPASVENENSDGTSAEQNKSLGEIILDGSAFGLIFYIVLGIFSIAAVSVTLERVAHLTRPRVMPQSFVDGLRGLVDGWKDSVDEFRQLCDTNKAPISNILKAGVLRAGRPLPEVEKAMEDAAAREMAEMRARNRPLSVIGSVAPLVGLLGTVVGMIFAFRVSSQAGLGKAELLAEGIYLALMTTAAGLTIAIPCLLLAAWFNGRAEKFMREIDECLLETMPSFTRMETSHSSDESEAPVSANFGG